MTNTAYVNGIVYQKLNEWGLAQKILDSPADFDMDIKDLARHLTNSKHRDNGAKERPHYYRFVTDYVRTVMDLDPSDSKGRIEVTPKSYKMDAAAVNKFKIGWSILQMRR